MILSFDKPKKIRSTEEHNKMYSSDCGVAGTYVPNMSEDDRLKWKAKHIKGNDERIEIRKELGGANLLVVVYKDSYIPPCPKYPDVRYNHPDYDKLYSEYKEKERDYRNSHNEIKISTNGKMDISWKGWEELQQAILEAKMLMNVTDPQNLNIENF